MTWTGSAGSRDTRATWVGALVTVPFAWYYSAPDGSLHHCNFALQYTMAGPYSVVGQNMITPTIIAI